MVGLTRLKTVTSYTTLRRSKGLLKDVIKLPKKDVIVYPVEYPEGVHKEVHDRTYEIARQAAEQNFFSEEAGDKDPEMFVKLLRVRQVCCSAKLLPDSLLAGDEKEAIGHDRSPKIQAMINLINEMEEDEKAVIYSEWTSFLDLIGTELTSEGIKFGRIDGSMSPEKRQEAMNDLNKGPSRLMLCSLRAAGVGITLTRANVSFPLLEHLRSGILLLLTLELFPFFAA